MTERDPMGPGAAGRAGRRRGSPRRGGAGAGRPATETRALEPAAPEALRERVRAQVAQAPPPERRSPFAWWGSAGARRRLLIAAPVAAGIAAVAIALPLVTGGDSGAPVGTEERGRRRRHRPAGVRSPEPGRPGAGRRAAGRDRWAVGGRLPGARGRPAPGAEGDRLDAGPGGERHGALEGERPGDGGGAEPRRLHGELGLLGAERLHGHERARLPRSGGPGGAGDRRLRAPGDGDRPERRHRRT